MVYWLATGPSNLVVVVKQEVNPQCLQLYPQCPLYLSPLSPKPHLRQVTKAHCTSARCILICVKSPKPVVPESSPNILLVFYEFRALSVRQPEAQEQDLFPFFSHKANFVALEVDTGKNEVN